MSLFDKSFICKLHYSLPRELEVIGVIEKIVYEGLTNHILFKNFKYDCDSFNKTYYFCYIQEEKTLYLLNTNEYNDFIDNKYINTNFRHFEYSVLKNIANKLPYIKKGIAFYTKEEDIIYMRFGVLEDKSKIIVGYYRLKDIKNNTLKYNILDKEILENLLSYNNIRKLQKDEK